MEVKKYSEFDFVNEEFLGKLVNFFKNMWRETIPNDVKDYILKNTLNVESKRNIFSQILSDFKKLEGSNDKVCFDLISNILDKENGTLGKQGIGILFSDKKLQGDDMKAKRRMMEYIIASSRDKTSQDIKFQIDPKKRNTNLDDQNYLPDLKKLLKDSKDDIKKKESTIKFVESVLIPKLIQNVKAIREEDIRKVLEKEGIEIPADFEVKDIVKYKTKKYNNAHDEDDQIDGAVAQGEVRKIEGDTVTIFNKNLNAEIKKTKEDIIGKSLDEIGDNVKKAQEILGKMKSDDEKMDKVVKFAEFIQNDENKNKLEEIDKILSGK